MVDRMKYVELINPEIQEMVNSLIDQGLDPLSMLETIFNMSEDPIKLLNTIAFYRGFRRFEKD